jgi:light-regulated signal transduction histidine kinase (bacteriophytochrome)
MDARISQTNAKVTAGPLPFVAGDATQLVHVFQNLLSNALKYRHADITPEIDISAQRDGATWIISIRDNGLGFQPQYAQRIFGLFKRLYKDEFSGTGLGLAICQRIIERCGGCLDWGFLIHVQCATPRAFRM